jgi:small subunit ribosomal protein S19
MSRSSKKGPTIDPKLMKRVMQQKDSGLRDPIKTWSRRSVVVPEFVGHTFHVHNGNKFLKVFVTEEMVGHKLGEFSPSRTFRGHPGTRAKAAATTTTAAAPAPKT